MELSSVLGLIKIALEVFQDQTKDRYLKKYLKIKVEYQHEIDKGIDDWSDLKLHQLRLEAENLAELIVRERNNSK
jgi:hypothetical protein